MAADRSNVGDTASGSSDPLSALHQITELVKDLQKLLRCNLSLTGSIRQMADIDQAGLYRIQGVIDPRDALSRVREVGRSIQKIFSEFPNYIAAGTHIYFLEVIRPVLVDMRRCLVDILPLERPHVVYCYPVDVNCNDPSTTLDHQMWSGDNQLLRDQGALTSMGAEPRFSGSIMQPNGERADIPWWTTNLDTLI